MASTLIETSEVKVFAGSGWSESLVEQVVDAADAIIVDYAGPHPPPPVDPTNPTAAELPNLRERLERRRVLVGLATNEIAMRNNRNLVTNTMTIPLDYEERMYELLGQLTVKGGGMYYREGMKAASTDAAQNR